MSSTSDPTTVKEMRENADRIEENSRLLRDECTRLRDQLLEAAEKLDRMVVSTNYGGWSTQNNRPMLALAADLRAAATPTVTMSDELSDDELRAIADEACAYVDDPSSVANLSVDIRSAHGVGYIDGVIVERKRARAIRALAVKLTRAAVLLRSDLRTAYPMSYGVRDSMTHESARRLDAAIDECRAAGLLTSAVGDVNDDSEVSQ